MNRFVGRMGAFTVAGTILIVALVGSPASAVDAVGQPPAAAARWFGEIATKTGAATKQMCVTS